jgi:predicted transcriptional regulator
MSKSSIETYLTQLNSGKYKKDAARVYRFIKRNPNCHKDTIIKELKLSHQTVTARLSDLLNSGVVFIKGSTKTITGSLSLFKVQEDYSLIQENINQRELRRFENWKKQGLTKFSERLSEVVLEGISA